MKIDDLNQSPTNIKFNVIADQAELVKFKKTTLNKLKSSVKVPGFRAGKAPDEMVEKHIDPEKLSNEFLNTAINDLYLRATDEQKLKVVSEPKIDITKFVPFTSLEFKAEVDVITKIELADYKKFKITRQDIPVTKEQVDRTLNDLRLRTAKFKIVERAAKIGDQVELDFEGTDYKTKEKLTQASGLDYKLILGSKNFIEGFEEQLVGLKAGDNKKFDITFPKDYHDTEFISRKVTFKVDIKSIEEVEMPKLDDAFAASLGPFKTITDFKAEIKRQLKAENDKQSLRKFEDDILNKLAETTKVEIPESLIHSEIHKLESDAKQNALYRGQSWPEFLSSIGSDEKNYHDQLTPLAELRIKGGLTIGEIATIEKIEITQTELDQQIVKLKEQYTDPNMRGELEKPENRREILMRLLSEKVLEYVKQQIK